MLVVCVAITRPLGGWLADRFDVLTILSRLFGITVVLALVMAMQISLYVELFAIYGLALLSGAAAAAVVKLIPLYFPRHVGAVSGLAKAAGAACGFTMTITIAASKDFLGGYTFGFAIWALMNVGAFYITLSRVGFKHAKPDTEAIPSDDGTDGSRSKRRYRQAQREGQGERLDPDVA
jgi:NNP family nitrate/nitrite transporter-like MFS transporter